jgi:hypothetical protein
MAQEYVTALLLDDWVAKNSATTRCDGTGGSIRRAVDGASIGDARYCPVEMYLK